jgi:hypothetical protein
VGGLRGAEGGDAGREGGELRGEGLERAGAEVDGVVAWMELSVSAYGVVWVVWEGVMGVVVVVLTLAEFAAARLELRDQRRDFGFLRLERRFGLPQLRFERCVFGLLDEERRVVGYGAEELLFGDLLDVGEAQF